LRQARLPTSLHITDQAFVTTEDYFALWRAVEALTADAGVGLKLVERTDTALHPPSSLAAFHARDYRDALLRTARFKRLCTPEQMQLAEQNGDCTITIRWLYAIEPGPPIATDVAFASLVELGRRGTRQHIIPRCVEFARTGSNDDVYRAYFGSPIRFGAARNALVMRSTDLDRPFPGHNPELLQILTPALAAALGELQGRSSISEQVKVLLKRCLASGRPELTDVARELAMSERTLQRRITDEGTTFRELLVEARQELGRQLLTDPSAEIDEVACLLGYQDASSFYRAFRDWEGVTPSRWRELNSSGPRASPDRPNELIH
jgi:AraC-like DNA-binding protein